MLHVAYDPQCLAPATGYSPSAAKPKLVMRDWEHAGLPVKIHPVLPATPSDLYLAHDVAYVRGVMNAEIENGFGGRSRAVADSLPWTVGAMVTAAKLAIALGRPVCAPVSGFHHAGYDFGGGFCTFNGLMVAALTVLQERKVDNVVILDMDHHWGNGTDDCLKHAPKALRSGIRHSSVGRMHYGHEDGDRALKYATRALQDLHKLTPSRTLVLYQAGADMHVDDPLGGSLTTPQLLERDRIVFSTCRELGVPVAWNLAGGYQRDANGGIPAVLEIHRNTAKASIE